jgi:hypothetical protein
MHIHSAQASGTGSALAGAQAAETAQSLRRARELRDAATKLRAASFDFGSGIPKDTLNDPRVAPPTESQADPQSSAQNSSLVSAWAGGWAASNQLEPALQNSVAQRSSADSDLTRTPPLIQEVQRTPPSGPISYWV